MNTDDNSLKRFKILTFTLAGVAVALAVLLTLMYFNPPTAQPSSGPTEPQPLDISPEELAKLAETNKAFVAVAEAVGPAVVQIRTVNRVRATRGFDFGPFGDDFFEDFFGPGFEQEYQTEAGGSGVIVSADGYVLTNNHVVENAESIEVQLTNGRNYDATVIGTDPATDLAVIKVDPGEDELPVARLGDSDANQVGDWVVALGSPFGLDNTVTAGIISAKGRSQLNILDYEDFIQTDAAINPGNSGGPLVNLKGEVIGINTAIFSTSGGYMGVGLAIPINLAQMVLDQLIDTGEVTRGWLGVYIQDVTPELAEALGLDDDARGALVGEVMPDTPAAEGGLESGDLITRVDELTIEDAGQLRNHIATVPPGEDVELDVLRDGEQTTLTVEIGERPAEESVLSPGLKPDGGGGGTKSRALGLEVGSLTPQLAAELGYEGADGVVVTGVESGSTAYRAGLRQGAIIVEVNRKAVDSPAEFAEMVERADSPVLLYVWNQGVRTYLALEKE
jgi:serine protease Do